MTHLRVEQNTITENVTSDVIHKLYETAKVIIDNEELNEVEESQVSLKGNLQVPKAYKDEVDWLEAKFPNLHINVTGGLYFKFEDPEVLRVLLANNWGDGSGVTTTDILSRTSIPSNMFKNNTTVVSFNELQQMPNITSIQSSAFEGCSNLSSIDLSNIQEIDTNAFLRCSSLTQVDASSVTSFGQNVFQDCSNLQTISLPDSLSVLPQSMFRNCKELTTIVGASNIQTVGEGAFLDCNKLVKEFDFSNTTSVAKNAFERCYKATFTNVDHVTNFGSGCFSSCKIGPELEFKDGVYIADSAFSNNSAITSIRFKGTGTLGFDGFRECKNLTSVTFDGDVQLGTQSFRECSALTSVDLSNISENSLFIHEGGYQFTMCYLLSSVILNPNLTKIPQGMFSYCGNNGLNLTIPVGVTDIGVECFYGTTCILTMLPTTPPTVHDTNTLAFVQSIRVPQGSSNAYKSAAYWSDKASIITEA